MAYNIIVKEEAQADTLEAFLYYEGKQDGLGERFLKELNGRYEQIALNPQHYGYLYTDKEKTLRRIKLNRFPYSIVYDISKNKVIVYMVHNSYKRYKISIL